MAMLSGIQEQIWNEKYRFQPIARVGGLAPDKGVEDTWWRIATALAAAEALDKREYWAKQFFSALEHFVFLPAGRIIAGAGTGRNVTLFNCFVQGTIPDSMAGIFQKVKEAALTMQQGGGIGMDYSTLRPRGDEVKGVGSDASGPCSFMDVWNVMCKTIMSAGARRGAMMGCLRVDHPDIEEFIEAKMDPLRWRNFNVSVLVTDAFMECVREGHHFILRFGGKDYKSIYARDLWAKIMRSAYDSAEPGVIFIDRINARNNLAGFETIAATNPCAEQPLPPNGACLLGSINLAALIRNPFEEMVYFDLAECERVVKLAVRMMDNVIDVSKYPLTTQTEEARLKRRIGLGITGLADALCMCGVKYGDEIGRNTAGSWMALVNGCAIQASEALAAEKGAFPLYKKNQMPFPARRNSHLTSIAPTGTISLFAGNVSSGIEPIFMHQYERKVLNKDGTSRQELVEDFAVAAYRKWASKKKDTRLPAVFEQCAHQLTPMQHLGMMAAVQEHCDSSISKTLNYPADGSFEDFENIYQNAYALGIKCVSVFRPNAITGEILSAPKASATSSDAGWVASPMDSGNRPAETGAAIVQTIEEAENRTPKPWRVRHKVTGEFWYGPEGETFATAQEAYLALIKIEEQCNKPNEFETYLATNAGKAGQTPWPPEIPAAKPQIAHAELAPRPEALHGATYKLKWPGSPHAIYVTINDYMVDDSVAGDCEWAPYEIFINSKNLEHYSWTVGLTRMISAIFRRGGDIAFVAEELKAVFDPKGGAWMDGKYVPSLLAAIGGIIEKHMGLAPETIADIANPLEPTRFIPLLCPKCNSGNISIASKCTLCLDCGYSKCD